MIYNFVENKVINPFEGVKYILLSDISVGIDAFKNIMHNKAKAVTTRKVGSRWVLLFDITLIDISVHIRMLDVDRGILNFGNYKVHVSIDKDTLICW